MKEKAEMTREELIALGWVKKPLTAVEFLIKEFSDILGPIETTVTGDLLLVDAIKKAKEMETEQKEAFYKIGYLDGESKVRNFNENIYNDIYNKTFKSE